MSIEKPIENWTKYPNCILDNLEKFTSSEIHVLSLMVRKNIGYDKPNKKFSISYISLKTGLSKSTVKTICKNLLAKNSIKLIGNGERNINIFDINWAEPTWPNSDLVKIQPSTRPNSDLDHGQNLTTLLENKVIDNKLPENNLPSNELKVDEADELINHWNTTFYQKLILSKKDKGPVFGMIKKYGLDGLKKAITRARARKDKRGINYTWGSIIYKDSNIADLLSEENKSGHSDAIQEALRKSREGKL